MIQNDTEKIEKTVAKAIEHCKTCQCNGCPFNGRSSSCLAVLEYLIKNDKKVKRDDDNNDN